MSAEHELAEVLRLLPWPVPGRSDSLRSNGYSAVSHRTRRRATSLAHAPCSRSSTLLTLLVAIPLRWTSQRKEQNMNMKNMEGNGYAVLKPSALRWANVALFSTRITPEL